MRIPGRLGLVGGWNHTAKHIPGVQITLADGVSRCPREMLADPIRELTHSSDSREQSIGPRGAGFFRLCTSDNGHPHETRRRSMDANDERSKFTRLTRAPFMIHASLKSWPA